MARILVVEDENYQAMEMSWMIEDAGYSVVGPEASVEATRQVLAQQRVDLALLDVMLGGGQFPMSGYGQNRRERPAPGGAGAGLGPPVLRRVGAQRGLCFQAPVPERRRQRLVTGQSGLSESGHRQRAAGIDRRRASRDG